MIDSSIYRRLFIQDADGQAVLEELSNKFSEGKLYVAGDTHETAMRLGGREVIKYILRRCKGVIE